MHLEVQVSIQAPRETVWKIVTDIENAVETISAIEEIEILERPADSFVGLKWRETRTMFGKTATEVMWITEATENEYYNTRAESHGAIYKSTIALAEQNGGCRLSMRFNGESQTFGSKLMMFLMGWMFKGATQKALQQDLEDIKKVAEAKS